ncbi:retrotransposon protein, putative, ty1-copia subclass [Tanacetum coccineum]
MGNPISSLQSVKTYLGKCFAMKDLEEATFILGIKIYRDRSKRLIGLSQSAYMDKILKRYKMDNSKRGYIPMQERLDLNKTQSASTPREVKRMHNVPYALAIGSIMYALNLELIAIAMLDLRLIEMIYDRCTDISKIIRKPSKTGKHGHGKRKSTKEAKDSEAKPRKVNPQSTMGKEKSTHKRTNLKCFISVPSSFKCYTNGP